MKLSKVFCLDKVLFLDTLPSRDESLSPWLRGDVTWFLSRDEVLSTEILRGDTVQSFSSLRDLEGCWS